MSRRVRERESEAESMMSTSPDMELNPTTRRS